MLVQFACFRTNAVGAAADTAISMLRGDRIARIGYRIGSILGLLITGIGACSSSRRRWRCPIPCSWARSSSSLALGDGGLALSGPIR